MDRRLRPLQLPARARRSACATRAWDAGRTRAIPMGAGTRVREGHEPASDPLGGQPAFNVYAGLFS